MISREDAMETLQRQLAGLISTLEFRPSAEHPETCMPMAGAVLALIQPEVERIMELDAAWLRHTWPCGHISEGTGDEPDRCRICVAEERVRNAEALAANLRRVDNERAIELMRVKRDLITVRDAAEGRG